MESTCIYQNCAVTNTPWFACAWIKGTAKCAEKRADEFYQTCLQYRTKFPYFHESAC